MPLELKPPRKGKSPNYTIRGTYLSQYVDRSARTPKRSVALKVLDQIQREIERGEFSEPGAPTFASAVASYVKNGGIKSKNPARVREAKKRLSRLLEHFRDTPISKIDQAEIDAAASALYPKAGPATRNRQCHTPVCAVLKSSGMRVDLRRPRGSGGNRATAWLWPEQAHGLIEEAEKFDPRFGALLTVLCYTGLRLSEALGLTWDKVRLQDGYAYVPDTKSGEPRAVFLPPVAVAALGNLSGRGGNVRVFAFAKGGHLYHLLRAAAARAGVDLPERSAFHIFRHTYATWMRRYAGADSQALIATGAWKDRKSVDRYTHTVVSEEAQKAALLPVRKIRGKRR